MGKLFIYFQGHQGANLAKGMRTQYLYIYIFAQPNNLNLNKQLDMTLGDRSTDFGQSLRSPCTDLKRTHPGKKTKISYLDRLSVFNTPKTTRVHRSGRNANAVRHVIDAPH